MQLERVGFQTQDFAHSCNFYRACLAPIGLGIIQEGADWALVGMHGDAPGKEGQFWFGVNAPKIKPLHLSFQADTQEQVDAFHANALEQGGTDGGMPSVRKKLLTHYYSARIIDPDGHTIEVTCYEPHVGNL